MEAYFFAGLILVLGGVSGYLRYVTAKGPAQPELPSSSPPPISQAVQEELDQSPYWWDREFHQALKRAGERVVLVSNWEPDVIVEKSANGSVCIQYYTPQPSYFAGCLCSDCEKNKRLHKYGR